MCTMLPEIVLPDFVTWLVTITAISPGTLAGGGVLLPGSVVQVLPQVGAVLPSSKPLKLAGPEPVLSALFFHHCDPHQLTWPPETFSRSPITKDPPAANGGAVQVTVTVFEVIVPAGFDVDACSVSVPPVALE